MRILRACVAIAVTCAGLAAGTPAKICEDQLAACSKKNNCQSKPDSAACKACKTEFDKCASSAAVQRAAKKTTKR